MTMTRVNGKRLISQLCLLLVIFSCVSPLDIPVSYTRTQMVISGQISTISDQNFVNVSKTATTERLPEPVSGALVILFDDLGNSFNYSEYSLGDYKLPGFAAEPGRTYHLEVYTPDGKSYISSPEKTPEDAGEFEPYFEVVDEEIIDGEGTISTANFFKIYVDSQFPDGSADHIRWQVEEVYLLRPTDFPDPFGMVPPDCFITQNADPQTITLLNRQDVSVNKIEKLLVASRPLDQSFHYRHAFTIFQSGLTAEALEYWRKVNIAVNQNGSLFDPPPASVPGNFVNIDNNDEIVLGYFQAVNQNYKRIIVLQSDVGVFLPPYCDYDPLRQFNDYPYECLDCIRVRNSSYIRPEWF